MPEVLVSAENLIDEEPIVDFQKKRASLESIFDASPDTLSGPETFAFNEEQAFNFIDGRSEALELSQLIDDLILQHRRKWRNSSVKDTPQLIKDDFKLWGNLADAIKAILRFSKILNSDYLHILQDLYPLASTSFLLTKGYSLIVPFFDKRILKPKELICQYQNYAEGIETLSDYIEECLQYPDSRLLQNAYSHVYPFADYFLIFIDNPLPPEVGLVSNTSLRKISSLSRRIKYAAKSIKYDVYRAKNFPFDLVDGKTIYVDPDTAEGKSLSRIALRSSNSFVSREKEIFDEEVDLDDLIQRLDACGYKEIKG